MKNMKNLSKFLTILVVVGLLVGLPGTMQFARADSPRATYQPAAVSALSVTGVDCTTATCNLYATTGSISLPGLVAPVSVFGYTAVATDVLTAPGGPTIVANQGDSLSITLNNNLAEATSFNIPGFFVTPDMQTDIPVGGSTTFTFVADRPGTFLYEAGLSTAVDGTRQVALGLYGVLVVRPSGAPGQAYNNTSTAFTDEVVMLLSEIDPDFNANPSSFILTEFKPQYWLLNGQPFPNTPEIVTAPGSRVLLRYVNAGLQLRSMGILGMHQDIIATDGGALINPHLAVAESLAAGETMDTIATIPNSAVPGQKFAIYDTTFNHNNNELLPGGGVAFGGIFTFLSVPGTLPPAEGPMVSALTASLAGNVLSVSATFTDASTGGQTVDAGEFSVDGNTGLGISAPNVVITGGAFGAITTTILFDLDISAVSSGQHSLYVRGQDINGWGPFKSVFFAKDSIGPVSYGLSLSPVQNNGTSTIQIWGTADDSTTGLSTIQAAEFFIGAPGADGSGLPMVISVSTGNPWIASLYAGLTPADLIGIPEGINTLFIHSQDVNGYWGAFSTLDLAIDRTGPTASGLSTVPASTFDTRVHANLRINATLTDGLVAGVNSNVVKAEAFFDLAGADGSGYPLMALDGVYNSTSENVFVDIPLVIVNLLAQGNHTIYIHGRDASGNWGSFVTVSLTVEKGVVDTLAPVFFNLQVTPPIVDLGILAPAAAPAAPSVTEVTLTGTSTDPGLTSNIALVEYFLNGNDPGQGSATPVIPVTGSAFNMKTSLNFTAAIPVASLQSGLNIISIRALDGSGNWTGLTNLTVFVTPSAPGTILFIPMIRR